MRAVTKVVQYNYHATFEDFAHVFLLHLANYTVRISRKWDFQSTNTKRAAVRIIFKEAPWHVVSCIFRRLGFRQ